MRENALTKELYSCAENAEAAIAISTPEVIHTQNRRRRARPSLPFFKKENNRKMPGVRDVRLGFLL